jgi:hypothetical protein
MFVECELDYVNALAANSRRAQLRFISKRRRTVMYRLKIDGHGMVVDPMLLLALSVPSVESAATAKYQAPAASPVIS